MEANQELRAKLTDIERHIAAVQLEAKPTRDEYDAKLRPFIEQECAMEEEKELLLDAAGTSVIGSCEGCSTLILEGDRHTWANDEVMYFCVECSPTWTEALAEMRSYTHDHPDDQRELDEKIAHAEAQIAADLGNEKVC